MNTLGAIVRDSPLLAGAVVILVAIFIFLLIAITGARRAARPEPARQSRRRHGRDQRDGYDFADLDRDYGPAVRNDDYERDYGRGRSFARERRRSGFAMTAMAFIVGIAIGLGLFGYRAQLPGALSSLFSVAEATSSTAREQSNPEPTPPPRKVAEVPPPAPKPRVVEPSPSPEVAETPPSPPPPEVAETAPSPSLPEAAEVQPSLPSPDIIETPPSSPPPTIRDAKATTVREPADLERRLAGLVKVLQDQLPKDVGPEVQLTAVRSSARVVTLGYTINRVASDDDAKTFQGSLNQTVRGIICSGKANEVRYLSDNGVEFYLIFGDQIGRTVGKFAALPKFCEGGSVEAGAQSDPG